MQSMDATKADRRRALRREARNCLKLAILCVVLAAVTNGWISIMGGDPTPAFTAAFLKGCLAIAALAASAAALLLALSSSDSFLRRSVRSEGA